ncbi:MAG: hypothetical protein OEX02_14210 [Cyclobacteriaceae bacterium]|nr:hypothetical protein [Cyclobacteriaceae bacterium]
MRVFGLLAVSIVLVFTTACNKEDAEPTVESQLIGSWTADSYYYDGEFWEYYDIFPTVNEYKEDGTGVSTITGLGEQQFTWSYDATTEKLTINMAFTDFGGGVTSQETTIVGDITKLDATNLWYTYQDAGVTAEERFVKAN